MAIRQLALLSKRLTAFAALIYFNFGFIVRNGFSQIPAKIDTTINKKLKLENYQSLKNLGVNKRCLKLAEGLRESPVIFFLNKSRTEYLLAYQYEGDAKNAFACFEIGYASTIKLPEHFVVLRIKHFKTETGLKLGILKSELIKLKGQPINPNKIGFFEYKLDASSSFVKRYRMPGYFLNCKIRQSKVELIKFGFDYP